MAPRSAALRRDPPLLLVMGVSGSGKTSVAAGLAQRLRVPFGDADDLHPEANVAKMAAGHPLTDADREPWLHQVAAWLHERRATGAVIACSALKRSYRDLLRAPNPGLVTIHLSGSRELIGARLMARTGHFMPAGLLDSQLATLEPLGADEPGLSLDVTDPVDVLVERSAAFLDLIHPDGRTRS